MASRGVNKVILVGNVGSIDVKQSERGAIANISIATSEQWKDKDTGEKKEKTEWHRVVIFGKLAEITAQYVNKGSKLYLEGQLRTRKWQGDDGTDRWSTEIVANEMQMLDSRQSNDSGSQQSAGNSGGQQAVISDTVVSDLDDDIPF